MDTLRNGNFPKTALLIDVEGFSWEVLQAAIGILAFDATKVIFREVQDDNFTGKWKKMLNRLVIF